LCWESKYVETQSRRNCVGRARVRNPRAGGTVLGEQGAHLSRMILAGGGATMPCEIDAAIGIPRETGLASCVRSGSQHPRPTHSRQSQNHRMCSRHRRPCCCQSRATPHGLPFLHQELLVKAKSRRGESRGREKKVG
jgi:hypothetical protein